MRPREPRKQPELPPPQRAKIADNKTAPVSVFISRQTQTLYVRQGFRPIFDTPITIRDPDTPIGTTIFTALNYTDDGADVRWNALAMYANGAEPAPAGKQPQRKGAHRQAEPAATDAAAAKAALERITIPQEAPSALPSSWRPATSLIISDEALHKETSKGTGLRGADERRTAGRHQDPPPRPQRGLRLRALVPAFTLRLRRQSLLLVVTV